MQRLSALLLGSDARSALRSLGAMGAMEIEPPGPGEGLEAPPENTAAMARCRAILARAAELRAALGIDQRGAARHMEFEDAAAAFGTFSASAGAALKRLEIARLNLSRVAALRLKLSAYSGLPLPSDAGGLSFVHCAAGSVPSENLKGLLAAVPAAALVFPLEAEHGRSSLAALCGPSSAAALDAALGAAGFAADVPAVRGSTLQELAGAYEAEERAALAEVSAAEAALKELGAAAGTLDSAENAAAEELRLLEVEQRMPRTRTAMLVSGWVPAAEAGAVAAGLAVAAGGRCAVETAAGGADAPVLLRPPGLLKAFAGLVSAYGLPGYGEVDPTAFAAAVYVLLFGAMFGDVGHGAVVCLAALFMLRLPRARFGDAALMMFCCGLSGMFFGLVYGSLFGFEFFRKYALWRDPLSGDPFTLVLIALGAGAAVITVGLLLNISNRLRGGDRLGAALGRFGAAGLLFYWSAILLLAGKLPRRLALPAICGALVCWALKGPLLWLARRGRGGAVPEESPAEVAAEAAVGVFEGVLLYLANTISFARLAAYAMSHAALLAAAFMLAGAADRIWGEGSLPGILAVAAGNIAAILLEGVVAAVQALRLEYYEFFGKFFEGGGRPFRPFVLGTGGVK